jgi:hypothetical protein
MIEPTALYAWSAIRRTGTVDDGLARVLDAVRALSEERGWMEPLAADYWLPAEDMSETLRSHLDRLMSSIQPTVSPPGGPPIHSV